jgi:hypothetical protein
VSYLRLTPDEYRALRRAGRGIDARRTGPGAFRHALVLALSGPAPALAERVAGLPAAQVRLVRDHLRNAAAGRRGPRFSAEELEALAAVCVPVLASVRFVRPLRRAVVRHFLREAPDLGRKLAGLSEGEFEQLCDQARGRGKSAGGE